MNDPDRFQSNRLCNGNDGVRVKKKTSVASWVLAVVVVLVVAVVALYVSHKMKQQPPAAGETAPSATTQVAPATATSPRHPITQAAVPATASTASLPPLGESDDDVIAALMALTGGDQGRDLLVSTRVVARIVATIDALPRRAMGTLMLPAHPPKGAFATVETDGHITVAAQNSDRYTPYIEVMQHVDPAQLVAWYARAYPMFQQAYQELGYPHGYFNDRLIVVIDDLLAAPELAQPALLLRSKSHYVFADPALESLSAGQRLLLRTGPANEALIKAKLRAIRAILVGTDLPAAGRPAPGASSGPG
ncbi:MULTISPECIES: DUF3014 domain-containing protein [Rhodanobacter]|uniref:DUF3014 domain-containing protein n=1 Tax=Rhodanobacter ginsenosidimutans TaxID=490571 RepID=A0ABW0JV79_9GAMM|nr:DUF3014 domain-containing protein [Rhodanobacter sp. Root627]